MLKVIELFRSTLNLRSLTNPFTLMLLVTPMWLSTKLTKFKAGRHEFVWAGYSIRQRRGTPLGLHLRCLTLFHLSQVFVDPSTSTSMFDYVLKQA
jgi:hypothetical protein